MALLALAMFVGGCSSDGGKQATPTTTTASPATSGAVRSVPPTTARPQPLSTRLELPVASMIGGSTVTGHLVVDNNTGKPLRLLTSGGCYPGFAVALGNDKIPPQAAFGTSCTTGEALVIPVGESRYVFSVRASYFGCSNTGHPQGTVPACLPGGRDVPLPTGQYRATFIDDGTRLPHPAPVQMRVLATGT